jgi:hypothetical protein
MKKFLLFVLVPLAVVVGAYYAAVGVSIAYLLESESFMDCMTTVMTKHYAVLGMVVDLETITPDEHISIVNESIDKSTWLDDVSRYIDYTACRSLHDFDY